MKRKEMDEEFKTESDDSGRMSMNRRTFMKMAGVAAGAVAFGGMLRIPSADAAIPGGTLDPLTIPKYVTPLVRPPMMPTSRNIDRTFIGDYYEIAMRQFTQQILPPTMPETKVWSYGSANHPTSFNYPAFTVEATYNKPVRVKWMNQLVDAKNNYLPHLLPVDQTLHWANPPGPRDSRPTFLTTPGRYTGPVPIVPHLHGGHSNEESDGYPEAWFLPTAKNIPAGYFTEGSKYLEFKTKFALAHPNAPPWVPGTAIFEYDNNQRASTLWYHDHSLGMTRTNVQAGPAGFYLLRGGPGDLPAGVLPSGLFEIPILIQDRSFNDDGSLFYPDSRLFFDGFAGPYIPTSDISPIHNPEFFGNTMVVNGKTWPQLTVEKRRYRFRFLNGTDSRFLILKMSNNLPFYQIGSDGGFLPNVEQLPQLLIGPAERDDVIVDFTDMPVGTQIILQNIAPDSPFGGGRFTPSDPATTGQVMRFDVVAATSSDNTALPMDLVLPTFSSLGSPSVTRQVSLNELNSAVLKKVGPRTALLGTLTLNQAGKPVGVPLEWMNTITENPAVNATEVWEIYNFTADAHPIHIHEVQFQVVNRQVIGDGMNVRGPDPGESGDKDTVVAYPGEITRVKALYDRAGLFVWHCHILSHEDNEMMRPYRIGP